MDLPGNIGYAVIGDSSLDFVRDPNKYVQKKRERHGDIFRVRIVNKPMVFATSNRAACEMLQGNSMYYLLHRALLLQKKLPALKWAIKNLCLNFLTRTWFFKKVRIGHGSWNHVGNSHILTGHEWKEARSALEKVFASEKIPEYLVTAKQWVLLNGTDIAIDIFTFCIG